jgi:protein-L-isoaspartate(D-aspartate) O-methyltransferase
MINHRYFETPSADPAYLYQNALVAIDPAKGVNNGEPFLHAAWIGAIAPRAGEAICHIGAGTGYYTAILSMLVAPAGRVTAYEIDATLAEQARHNLKPFEHVALVNEDATRAPLPPSDLIYVNAGVSAPPLSWLRALAPAGRMILPWRPSKEIGLAIVISRQDGGYSVKPLMPSWFIPCVGASDFEAATTPKGGEAWTTRAVWPKADRAPDQTAVAVYRDVWFSSAPP